MSGLFRRIIVSLTLPFVIVVGLPIVVVLLGDADGITWLREPPQSYIAFIVGALLVVVGLILGLATIPLFFRQSQGTIMPWEPSTELIVEGVYRHVRNPMHIGVFAIVFGEGLLLRSASLLIFATLAVLLHLFYIPFSEERGLEKRFGEAYRVYKQNVPRWIPRWTPWKPDDGE